MKRWAHGAGLVLAALLAGGCISSGPVQLSADTYRLSRADGGGVYADAAAMKAAVIGEANAFAQSRGKIAVPVEVHEEATRVGHLSTIDYDFRLMAPGDPVPKPAEPARQPAEPVRQSAEPARLPDAAGEQQKPVVVAAAPAGKVDAKPDIYTELIKLDELRRRGILTEEEFRTLKAKLIAAQ